MVGVEGGNRKVIMCLISGKCFGMVGTLGVR